MLELANWAAEHTTANFAIAPEPLSEWLALFDATAERHAWLVAVEERGQRNDGIEASETIIGFAKCGPHRKRAAYDWAVEITVYLDERIFGRGVGTKLYEALIEITRRQGYRTILAGITTGHAASEALHQKLGFMRCGTFHRVGWKFDAWHDVSYWELVLGEGAPSPIAPVAEVIGDVLATLE